MTVSSSFEKPLCSRTITEPSVFLLPMLKISGKTCTVDTYKNVPALNNIAIPVALTSERVSLLRCNENETFPIKCHFEILRQTFFFSFPHFCICLSSQNESVLTWLRPKYVIMAKSGAAAEKTARCFLILFRSNPSCSKNDTNPNAAGA